MACVTTTYIYNGDGIFVVDGKSYYEQACG